MYLGNECPFCGKALPQPSCHDDVEEYYKDEEEFNFKCYGCEAVLNIGAEDIDEAANMAKREGFGWLWVQFEGWMCPACQKEYTDWKLKELSQRSVDSA